VMACHRYDGTPLNLGILKMLGIFGLWQQVRESEM
jgi:hypothetical protein